MPRARRIKGPKWTREQDRKLYDYAITHGAGSWNTVAREIRIIGKTGNSCRQRWVNYLAPGVVRTPLTDAEKHQILLLYRQLGNKWSEISRRMGGRRSDNAIKNYFNTHLKKEARLVDLEVGSEGFLKIMTQRYMDKMELGSVDYWLQFGNDDWGVPLDDNYPNFDAPTIHAMDSPSTYVPQLMGINYQASCACGVSDAYFCVCLEDQQS